MGIPNLKILLLLLGGSVVPALMISWVTVWILRGLAPRLGLMDRPGERKVHEVVTPLGGGIGIWAGVLGTFMLVSLSAMLIEPSSAFANQLFGPFPDSWLELYSTHREGIVSKLDSLWLLLGAGTLLMILGLVDDRIGLDWKLRLGLQFGLAAVCVAFQGWRATAFINIPLITGVISVIWIVGLINAFNMLDNMDGLSGGVALIAATMLGLVLLSTEEPGESSPQLFVSAFLFVLAGGVLGFLGHNFPRAKIFMGDAGSYFVGFSVAVATLLATYTGYHSNSPHAILAPLFVMTVPLYDMTSVILIRLKEGRSPFSADKNHLSHRLVELGFSKTQAVLTIYLLTGTCGIAAVLLHRVDVFGAVLLSLLVLCIIALIALIETTARRRLKS